MTESEALLAIQHQLSGNEWSPDTLCRVAEILEEAGFNVEDNGENHG